jgi:hypothetical protein
VADRYGLACLTRPESKVVVPLGGVRVKLVTQAVHSKARSVLILSRCARMYGTFGRVFTIVSQDLSERYVLAPQVAHMHCASSRVVL